MIKLKYPSFWGQKNIISYLLWPISLIYKATGRVRKLLATEQKLNGFVICVGNATIGGTGKTQLVSYLARRLQASGLKTLIVTKAYNSNLRRAKLVGAKDNALDVGDESVLLSADAQVIAAKGMDSYAIALINDFKADVIIFDDGLQNPYFHKDYNILVLDTKRHLGNNMIFPSGPLREHLHEALAKTDIVVTIGDDDLPKSISDVIHGYDVPLFSAKISGLSYIITSRNYLAFAGIGDPERFFKSLEANGAKLVYKRIFPDHHYYTSNDIKILREIASTHQALLITTRKDLLKISEPDDIICFEVKLEFESEKFLELIYEKITLFS